MEFKRILFPVDFSEDSEACMRTSARLLADDGSHELHFLYVLHTPTDFSTWSGDPKADVQKRLAEFIDEFKPQDQEETTSAVVMGHPSTEICKYAAEHRCDLVVMATHGRTGLAHMVLGSTAEQVVRHAPCPVLTLRVRRRPDGPGLETDGTGAT